MSPSMLVIALMLLLALMTVAYAQNIVILDQPSDQPLTEDGVNLNLPWSIDTITVGTFYHYEVDGATPTLINDVSNEQTTLVPLTSLPPPGTIFSFTIVGCSDETCTTLLDQSEPVNYVVPYSSPNEVSQDITLTSTDSVFIFWDSPGFEEGAELMFEVHISGDVETIIRNTSISNMTIDELEAATEYDIIVYTLTEHPTLNDTFLHAPIGTDMTNGAITRPLPPTSAIIDLIEQNKVDISWTADDKNGNALAHFIVQQTQPEEDIKVEVPLPTTLYSAVGLTSNTIYEWIVYSATSNPDIHSEYVTVNATTSPATPQLVQQDFTQSNDSSVTINWSMDKGGNAFDTLTYFVTLSGSGKTWTEIVESAETEQSLTITDLESNTDYTVTIIANNGLNSTESSPIVAFTAPSSPSDIVHDLAQSNDNSVTIHWTMDKGGDATGTLTYFVTLSGSDKTWTEVVDSDATAPSSTITDLESNTNYDVTIIANNGLNSTESPSVVITTAPSSPFDIVQDLTQSNDSSVTINWSMDKGGNAFDILTYTIELYEEGVKYQTFRLTTSEPNVEFVATGLESNAGYNASIRSHSFAEDLSSSISHSLVITSPATPHNVRRLSGNASAIVLEWDMDLGKQYEPNLQYAVHSLGGGISSILPTLELNAALLELDSNTAYDVFVIAKNDLESQGSDVVTMTTAPLAPANVTQIVERTNDTRIAMTWNVESGGNANESLLYTIEIVDLDEEETMILPNDEIPNVLLSHQFTPNTNHTIRMKATNLYDSEYSEILSVWSKPSSPAEFEVTVLNSTDIALNWTNVDVPDVEYALHYDSKVIKLGQVDTIPIVRSGFTPGRRYTFTLIARSTLSGSPSYESAPSESQVVTMPPLGPTGGSYNATNSSIAVSWEPVESAVRYEVQLDDNEPHITTNTSYLFEDLESGRMYMITVTAISDDDVRSPEPMIFPVVDTIAPPPGGVTVDNTSVSTTSAKVEWIPPQLPAVNPSEIEYEVSLTDSASTTTHDTEYVFSDLDPGTEYEAFVWTHNTGGDSSAISVKFATTPPAPVLHVSAQSNNSLRVEWEEPAVNLHTFDRKYTLSFKPTGTTEELTIMDPIINGNSTIISDLNSGTLYDLHIALELGTPVDGYFGLVESTKPFYTLPNAPTNVIQTSAAATNFTISWDDAPSFSMPPVDFEYVVSYTAMDGDPGMVATRTSNPGETSILVENVNPGTSYVVEITTNIVADPSLNSTTPSTPFIARTVPVSPSELQFSNVNDTSFTFSWEMEENGDISLEPFTITFVQGTAPASSNLHPSGDVSEATFAGLTPSQTYQLSIVAENVQGKSIVQTSDVMKTEPGVVVDLRSDVVDVDSDSRYVIRLRWTSPLAGDIGIGEYVIYYGEKDNAERNQFTVSHENGTSEYDVEIDNLKAETMYEIDVVTIDGDTMQPPLTSANATISVQTAAATPPDVPPANVFANSTGRYSIHVQWEYVPLGKDGGQSVTGYVVELHLEDGGSKEVKTILNADELSTEFSGLRAGTNYTVEVAAKNGKGTGNFSDPYSVTTDAPGVPNAPSAVDLSVPAERHSLSLKWTRPTDDGGRDIEKYIVNWWTDDDIDNKNKTKTENADESFVITGLVVETQYHIEVCAVNVVGEGPCSDAVNFTTSLGGVPDESVTGVVTTEITRFTVNAIWNALSDADNGGFEVEGYTVRISKADDAQIVLELNTTETSIQIEDLQAKTNYTIQVAAFNKRGTGPFSALYSTRTKDPWVPQAGPANLMMTNQDYNSLSFEWEPSPDDGGAIVTHYMVHWRPKSNATDITKLKVLDTSIEISELIAGTEYVVDVYAYNEVGESILPATSNADTKDAVPSDTPQELIAIPSRTCIDLSWQEPSFVGGSPITKYTIRHGEELEAHIIDATPEKNQTFELCDLTIDTGYNISVSAENIAGISGSVSIYVRTVPPSPPTMPLSLATESVTNISVSLAWEVPKDDGGVPISQYIVEYHVQGNEAASAAVTETTKNSERKHVLENLSSDTSYVIRVKARNSAGKEGPASAQIIATTEVYLPEESPNLANSNAGLAVGLAVTGSLIGIIVVVVIVAVIVTVVAVILVRRYRHPKHGIKAHDGGLGTFYGTDNMVELDELMAV